MSHLPLILSLKLDQITFERFNELRQRHFPSERNFLPAHVTLFHKLPGDREADIQQTLQELGDMTPVLPLHFPSVRSLGQGVAIELQCPELVELRNQLAREWSSWLSAQDRQGYRPHITIQNKVSAGEAQQLYRHLLNQWQPLEGRGEGLLLWRYEGGPWTLVNEVLFVVNG
ncbi:2'-5' RNA ligase family protein [Oscillatoria sp. FACHB-1407]|uniref:2'-5' RNA ligase family protein n=1 Tax=Oscillatoria sp. FACHB-1407 TaxID=2692847 RepID=UPI00168205D1|nr:2'-5' RNA ligase family protein [Oscillatoria sp. FACHB-1407]MBD2459474.1 2'-5' RNA ligase family protein [Oscillatoria sp. FACHB-1407]